MNLKSFILAPAAIVTTVYCLFYAIAYYSVHGNLSDLKQSEIQTVLSSAKAKIQSKKDTLRVLGKQLENDSTLSYPYMIAIGTKRFKKIKNILRNTQDKHQLDIIDIVNDVSGKSIAFDELSSNKILLSAYKKHDSGFSVLQTSDKLSLLYFSPMQVDGSAQGILILGYYLDAVASEISTATNTSTKFSLADANSHDATAQIEVTTYGTSSIPLAVSIEGDRSSSLNQSTIYAIIFIGVLALILITVLIHIYTKRFKKQALEEAHAKAYADAAEDVIHDLRSPLKSFKSSVYCENPNINQIRKHFDRVNDVANLLIAKRADLVEKADKNETSDTHMIAVLTDEIIDEKKVQYRSLSKIEMEWEAEGSYGLFAKIQPREFKMALSNILDNAVQSIPDGGSVAIRMDSRERFAVIRITDTGCGIADENKEKIFERGFTYGKPNGSGLGLWQAKSAIESWEGVLRIESRKGAGTVVYILLPLARPPKWFVPKLHINPNQNIVILDDDPSVHEAWKERFKKCLGSSVIKKIRCFEGTADLTRWWKRQNCLFLCDYDLGGKETGIEVIKRLSPQKHAILVTGYSEKEKIKKTCQNMRICLIPKSLLHVIPISKKAIHKKRTKRRGVVR